MIAPPILVADLAPPHPAYCLHVLYTTAGMGVSR